MKHLLILAAMVFVAAVGLVGFQATASKEPSLARFMPAEGMLFLESSDFAGLLSEWNNSPEKAAWVKSDNYAVFSRSRLFLKLADAQEQFAKAAGLPADMKFLSAAAGKETALTIYDIGQLHMLYITKLGGLSNVRSELWQKRGTFQVRKSGSYDFYVRKDDESGRVAAFAVAGDYFVLATREDLIAGALSLISGGTQPTIASEKWFADAISAAAAPGNLRMVLDLEKISVDPRFRTYWIQQNITELHGYRAAVCDLYREGNVYREERVLLPVGDAPNLRPESAIIVRDMVSSVPADVGYYSAVADPPSDVVVSTIQAKLLNRNRGAVVVEEQSAPSVTLGNGVNGSGSDLETRIDQAPVARPIGKDALAALKETLAKSDVQAMIVTQSTQPAADKVFVRIDSAVVLQAAHDWDVAAIRAALLQGLLPGLTASELGARWQASKQNGVEYWVLDGLVPLALYAKGNLLVVADSAQQLLPYVAERKSSAGTPISYSAGVNLAHERANFHRVVGLMDEVNRRGSSLSSREPEFFSENIGSLSESLAAVQSQTIAVRTDKNRVLQTVTYQWAR
jgi:hypothetical protein